MKKVVNIISMIFIIVLFYTTKDSNIFLLTVSFSMYILLNSIFSTTNIKNNNYKLFKLSILSIFLIGIFLTIISFFIGNILNIDKLNIINIFMTGSLISNVILKLVIQYIQNINYKKLSGKLLNIYKIVTMIVKTILLILLFKVFKLDNHINIILLYTVDILLFVIVGIILYLLIFKNIKKQNKEKNNYIKEIKNILIGNKIITIYNIINSSYLYSSIIMLYYILGNKYNYSYNNISLYITNTYFYGLIAGFILYKIIKKYLNINIKDNFNGNIIKIAKVSFTLMILFTIISKPLSYLILRSDYNILAPLIPLLFTYILYDFTINTNMIYNKEKNIIIILIIGVITKIIFELPLINAIYRMGYTLTLGSVLSIILGLIISIFIGILLIKNKLKLNLLENFNILLNIIYENIIYALTLVLFTLIIKLDTDTIMSSILVILFYLFITLMFHIIKRILDKK